MVLGVLRPVTNSLPESLHFRFGGPEAVARPGSICLTQRRCQPTYGARHGVRLGRRWIITRHAYLAWERKCGLRAGTGLRRPPEVVVLN